MAVQACGFVRLEGRLWLSWRDAAVLSWRGAGYGLVVPVAGSARLHAPAMPAHTCCTASTTPPSPVSSRTLLSPLCGRAWAAC